jgi:hypothetical protein
MVETFALRLAAGMIAALFVLPPGVVEPRFYRIQHIIALCLLGGAAIFAWSTPAEWFWLPFGLAVGTTLYACYAWTVAEGSGTRYTAMTLSVLAMLASLLCLQTSTLPWDRVILEGFQHVTAIMLLGSTMTAMLLGHWYLIAHNLSITPLLRLHYAMFLALVLRLLCVALVLGVSLTSSRLDAVAWSWLSLRVGAGLLGVGILGYMAYASAKIRSTQSATGILYVVVVFVLVGEITDQLLLAHLLGK